MENGFDIFLSCPSSHTSCLLCLPTHEDIETESIHSPIFFYFYFYPPDIFLPSCIYLPRQVSSILQEVKKKYPVQQKEEGRKKLETFGSNQPSISLSILLCDGVN